MDDPERAGRPRLSAEQAFVVHLLETDEVYGRVEHVNSGRSMRFGSVAELIGLMQGTLRVSCTSENDADA